MCFEFAEKQSIGIAFNCNSPIETTITQPSETTPLVRSNTFISVQQAGYF